MNMHLFLTLLISTILELTLAAYLGILSTRICIPLSFWTLVLVGIFGIANKGFKQQRTNEEIRHRLKLVVKSYRITYMLMLALILIPLLAMWTPKMIFAQATIIINWNAAMYLILISRCRIKEKQKSNK